MFDIFIMDMGGHASNVKYLSDRFPHAKILRWTDHLGSIRRAIKQSRTRFTWVISSCIDYNDFDFDWEPVPWQAHQIHCWPSGDQQFGDTFLVPTQHWCQQESSLLQLEQYQDVNFEHHSLPRLPWQIIHYQEDTLPQALESARCETPYVLFANKTCDKAFDAWLWREQPVVSLSSDNGCSLIPRSAHTEIKEQIYDYKWLIKVPDRISSEPLDIVFISNGEHGAEHHFECLRQAVQQHHYQTENRIHRVKDIKGRVGAYQAAAKISTTPWFFAVFAKLQVNEDFDWTWQPDLWQRPKHYIFHAYNPVNHLVYGHQAMIAYNKELVLSNTAQGLDFTLDQPHEVVPIISGTAYYDNDPWTCWRTAFREALKLRHSLPDVENEYRLQQWLDKSDGINGHWSQRGAQDAMLYYDASRGDFNELKKSYEWAWLASYAMMLHPELIIKN